MRFVITAGGTAGHINPALAVANELENRGHQVFFAGSKNRLEAKLVPQENYEFKAFDAKSFNRSKPLSIIKAIISIENNTKLAIKWLKEINPDKVIGFGCYVSLPVCRAARKLKIPFLIHEQNSVMGMANKYLTKNAEVTCLTYERAKLNRCRKVCITGNPVRKSIFDAKKEDGRKMLGIPMDALVLLVFGGSLGASKINNTIIKLANDLLTRKNLYIVHITGSKQYEEVLNSLDIKPEYRNRYILLEYQNKMGETLAASDICISRAGASSIAELTARALPAILIPYPLATNNHQYYNASTLLDAGCVMMINDSSVATAEFEKAVIRMVDDEDLKLQMHDAYKVFEAQNSTKKVVELLES